MFSHNILIITSSFSHKSCNNPRPHTHGNVFLRFRIVSSNELVVLDSPNSKQYKNAGKRFRVYGAPSYFLAAYITYIEYNKRSLRYLKSFSDFVILIHNQKNLNTLIPRKRQTMRAFAFYGTELTLPMFTS